VRRLPKRAYERIREKTQDCGDHQRRLDERASSARDHTGQRDAEEDDERRQEEVVDEDPAGHEAGELSRSRVDAVGQDAADPHTDEDPSEGRG
jgi:hypothetical protein